MIFLTRFGLLGLLPIDLSQKIAEKRDSQSSKSSSDDPFQAIFHFFIDFSRRKIDHFSRVQPFHKRFAPFSPSSISAPYRNLTHLYPSNIDPKMDPKMWEPFGETRSIQSLYTIYIIPIQPLYIFDTHFVYQQYIENPHNL